MRRLIAIVAIICGAAAAFAQEPGEKLETSKLAENLYLITGPGGNIALLLGKNGVLLVDDQIAPMTPTLKRAVAQITPQPVRFVINTHWHGDHTGGNAVLGQEGAVIVAQDNVRKRLSTEQFVEAFQKTVPPTPESGWPVVTFATSVTLHFGGEDIEVTHVDPAHTDGDSIVAFKHANIIHTGDTFVSNGYPYIDLSSGGTTTGFFRAADRVLSMAQPSTRIIPGHGDVVTREQLKTFRGMLSTIYERIKAQKAAGKSLAAVQAAKPTADFDSTWGRAFISGSQLVETIYKDLGRSR